MDPSSQSFRVAGLLSRSVVTLFLIVAAVGTTLVCVFFFQEHTAQLSALAASDLRLDQAIYTEAVARLTKDMAAMQYQARLQSDLDADIAARQAKHATLDQGRQETTRLRLEGDQDIADRLSAEIQGRQDNDTLTQSRIANASTVLDALEAFDVFTLQQFMIKMDNITDITSDILAEIATRTGIDMALMVQDTLIQNALSILVSELNTATSERVNRDMVIMNQLGLITSGLIRTINYQNPLNGDIQIVSLTPTRLDVDNEMQNSTIVIRAYGIQTVAGVGPNPLGNVDLVEGQGITIDYPSPNTIRISATAGGSILGTNFVRLARVFPYGQATSHLGNTGSVDTLQHTAGNCVAAAMVTGCPTGWDCIPGYASNPAGRCRGATSGCLTPFCQTNFFGPVFFFCTGDGAGGATGGACIKQYCTNNADCADALGSTNWYCQNHRCTEGFSQGDTTPFYFGTYPVGSGNYYRRVPNNFEIVGNRPPSIDAIFEQGSGCTFPYYLNQYCGFMSYPYAAAINLVQFTVTLRIQTTNLLHTNTALFRMYLDYGSGWQQVDTEYVGQTGQALSNDKRRDSYVIMTTTRLISTAQYGFGNLFYIGWSAYVPYSSDPLVELYVVWYRMSYDITRLR